MWPRMLFSRIISLGSALSPRATAMSAALCLVGAPAFSQGNPLTNHLLERAQSGHVQEQLEVARAFQLGLGVDRDLAEAARWFLIGRSHADRSASPGLGEGPPTRPGHRARRLVHLLVCRIQRQHPSIGRWSAWSGAGSWRRGRGSLSSPALLPRLDYNFAGGQSNSCPPQ